MSKTFKTGTDFQFHPGYFGKVGMRHYHLLKNQYHCPTINIDKVRFHEYQGQAGTDRLAHLPARSQG